MNNHLSLQSIKHKKTTTNGIVNPGPGVGQEHNSGGIYMYCVVFQLQ